MFAPTGSSHSRSSTRSQKSPLWSRQCRILITDPRRLREKGTWGSWSKVVQGFWTRKPTGFIDEQIGTKCFFWFLDPDKAHFSKCTLEKRHVSTAKRAPKMLGPHGVFTLRDSHPLIAKMAKLTAQGSQLIHPFFGSSWNSIGHGSRQYRDPWHGSHRRMVPCWEKV